MEFQRPQLPEPQQRRQVVPEDVVVRAADMLGERRDDVDELRPLLIPMFLKNRSPPMPSGMRIIVSGRSRKCGSI